EALEMTPQELIDALVGLQDAYLAQYRNQREVGAQAIKDELEVALEAKVQAHRDAVTAGTAQMPDTTGVKQAYLNNYEGLKAEFVIRNQERIEYAHAVKNGEVAQYLVGEYNYEKSSEELPYIVTYHNFTLNSDGTYTESWSWVSRTNAQTTDGTDEGTWAVVEGILVFTNENEYSKDFEIQGARIVYENLDGILITFKKLVTTN
ncbi:MAG: lipocalin family protein, partial [Acholeplasmataceae bacterium]|nr:lipocalin family protein [Acholeplasmataceae bacterium]